MMLLSSSGVRSSPLKTRRSLSIAPAVLNYTLCINAANNLSTKTNEIMFYLIYLSEEYKRKKQDRNV